VCLPCQRDAGYTRALNRLLSFLRTYQIDSLDGIWLDIVAAEGKPLLNGKADR
jgi:hypothetical protein